MEIPGNLEIPTENRKTKELKLNYNKYYYIINATNNNNNIINQQINTNHNKKNVDIYGIDFKYTQRT